MKKFLAALLLLSACKTTKMNSAGKKVPTANTRHLQKIHKKSGTMWAGNDLIVFKLK